METILCCIIDIFDTILARTVEYPTFDIIEKKFPYKNFKNLRLEAQNLSNDDIIIDDGYHYYIYIINSFDFIDILY